MISGLIAGALLVGAGFMLTGRDSGPSGLKEAQELYQEGSNQVQAFKFAEGTQSLETALELDPELAEAAIGLAYAYGRMGRAEDYDRSLALADSLTANIVDDRRRMVAQMRLGHYHNSRFRPMLDSLLTRLTREEPNDIHVLVAQTERILQDADHDAKVEAWTNVLAKNPNFAGAYNNLGYLELYYGNYDQAIQYMKKYAFLAPDLANPHDSLGEVLMVKGDYEEASREFRVAIELQPDFHYAYINLAKTYLRRGMIKDGVAIMDQVHEMVEGTSLGEKVDRDLFETYFQMQMHDEVERMSAAIITNYPESDYAAVVRAIRYGFMDRMDDSQALMDSCLTHWRAQEYYHLMPKVQMSVELTQKSYEAHIADIADTPATRIRKWNNLVSIMVSGQFAQHDVWGSRINLAKAYLDDNKPREARAQIEPILASNNRVVAALILAVKTDLALKNADSARMALEQLKWSIQQSDEDYVGRRMAAELEDLVGELEGNS